MRRALSIMWIVGWSLLLPRLQAQAPVATPVGPRPLGQPLLRIGLIADAQYCDCTADKDRFYRISLEKLHQAVDTLNERQVDLVINLGDLIDQRLGSYPRALRELDRLQMPLLHVLGNHEFWDVPFHDQASVLDTLALSQGYCDYLLPGWRLLLLDGTELAAYAMGAHEELRLEAEVCNSSLDGHANAALWNGAIGQAQLDWIAWQLAAADAAGEHVLLFCHFPIHPAGHPMTLWNEADLRALVSRYKSPAAWIAGHAHEALYAAVDGLHHLTLEGMLMTPDSNAFAVLDLYPDRLVVEGYGREPYRVLPLRGAAVVADTLLPEAGTPPDAMPPVEVLCIDRRVVDWRGVTIFSEETDDLGLPFAPRLPAGCYGILEQVAGQYRFGYHVILPPTPSVFEGK